MNRIEEKPEARLTAIEEKIKKADYHFDIWTAYISQNDIAYLLERVRAADKLAEALKEISEAYDSPHNHQIAGEALKEWESSQ